MAANMLHNIKHNKHSMVVQSIAIAKYIVGQVTQNQRYFVTFGTAKIYNATFKIGFLSRKAFFTNRRSLSDWLINN